MNYPKPIKKILHWYWRGDKHILGWWYKQWYMKKIAKPLGLKSYRYYIAEKRRRNKKYQRKLYGNGINKMRRYKKILLTYSKCCGICGIQFKGNELITVDHIKHKLKHPELVYEITNMQLSHEKCNTEKSEKLSPLHPTDELA